MAPDSERPKRPPICTHIMDRVTGYAAAGLEVSAKHLK